MDNKKVAIWIFAILILSIVSYSILNGGGNTFDITSTGNIGSKYIEAPVFGWLSCETSGQSKTTATYALETAKSVKTTSNGVKWYGIQCNDFYENDGCSITLTQPDEPLLSYPTGYAYTICNSDATCDTSTKNIDVFKFGDQSKTKTISLQNSQFLYVTYQQLGLTGFSNRKGVTYKATITPWSLWKNDVFNGGRTELRFGNCDVDSSVKNSAGVSYLKLGIKSFDSNPSLENADPYMNRVQKNQPYNYIAGFVPRPSFDLSFQQYNGQTVQCRNGNLYSIETIETNGYTYNIVNSELQKSLKSVECCNGESRPGYYCEDNEWVEKQTSCSIIKPCTDSTQWKIDTTKDKTMIISQCIENECVDTTKTVTCTDQYDCPNGLFCEINANDPDKNKCVGTRPAPPNPDPIGTSGEKFNPLLLIASLIFGLLAGIFAYRYVDVKNKTFNVILAIVLGILSGFLLAYIIQYIISIIETALWLALVLGAILLLMFYGVIKAVILKRFGN